MRALAFFCHETMTALVPSAKEVAMDATFGTNHSGMDLFALLAEFDGSGFPLGYFLWKRSLLRVIVPRFLERLLVLSNNSFKCLRIRDYNPLFLALIKTFPKLLLSKRSLRMPKFSFVFGMLSVQFVRKCETPRRPKRKPSIPLQKPNCWYLAWKYAGDQCQLVGHEEITFLKGANVHRGRRGLRKRAG